MTEELPDVTDEELVKLLAAQRTLMDNKQLHDEYVGEIKEEAERYGVDVRIPE